MDGTTVASIAGSICAVIALIVVLLTKVYGLGERLGELTTKVGHLWVIYARDAEESLVSTGLMRRGSYIITAAGEKILPEDVKREIENITGSEEFKKIAGKESIENLSFFVVSQIGVERLASVANTQHIALQKVVVLAGVYAMKSFRP